MIRTNAPDSDPGVYVVSGSVLYVVESTRVGSIRCIAGGTRSSS